MSTRAIVNFYDRWPQRDTKTGRFAKSETTLKAKIYRHGDGYPAGLGKDLKTFLNLVRDTLKDTRFNSASYLSAKWVVHDAERMAKYQTFNSSTGNYDPVTNPLNFLSVGIMMKDPWDIEYVYDVICHRRGNAPVITCTKV